MKDICGVLIPDGDKFLLVQEKRPDFYGKWNLPGGHRDDGESLEQTATREAFEETGFEVAVSGLVFELRRPEADRWLHVFLAEIIGGSLQIPEDEILDAQWFTAQEVNHLGDELRDAEYILGAVNAGQKLKDN